MTDACVIPFGAGAVKPTKAERREPSGTSRSLGTGELAPKPLSFFCPPTKAERREPSGNVRQMQNHWARAQAAIVAAFCPPTKAERREPSGTSRSLGTIGLAPKPLSFFCPPTKAERREPSGNVRQMQNRWARAQAAIVAAFCKHPMPHSDPSGARRLSAQSRQTPQNRYSRALGKAVRIIHPVSRREAKKSRGLASPHPLVDLTMESAERSVPILTSPTDCKP